MFTSDIVTSIFISGDVSSIRLVSPSSPHPFHPQTHLHSLPQIPSNLLLFSSIPSSLLILLSKSIRFLLYFFTSFTFTSFTSFSSFKTIIIP